LSKRALITGITGQDGSYLAELLLEHGYEVHGLVRRLPDGDFERLRSIRDRLVLHRGDLLDQDSVIAAMRECEPEEVYNLAAMSVGSASWEEAVLTGELTGLGVTRVLEAMREVCPQARLCQASSSEVFGQAEESPQNELTPFGPRSPYGAAKAYAQFIVRSYRERLGLFACSAVLFNHESARRGPQFVTRKITQGAAAIKLGTATELRLGNLDARRDWGYAPDYVKAMWLMLQQDNADDFVLGTGRQHTVADLVEIAFNRVGLDAGQYVTQDPAFMRGSEPDRLVADSSKAYERLGWQHTIDFEQMVGLMVDADLARAEAGSGSSQVPADL
jgi:GDPmannose 4,6-dehydratase